MPETVYVRRYVAQGNWISETACTWAAIIHEG